MSFWLLSGNRENWEIAFSHKKWGIRGSLKKTWERVNKGDVLIFYGTYPISGIIGFGKVIKIAKEKTPLWSTVTKRKKPEYPYRIKFFKSFVLNDSDWETKCLRNKSAKYRRGLNRIDYETGISIVKKGRKKWKKKIPISLPPDIGEEDPSAPGLKFEGQVRKFLEEMGFENVEGGRKFRINNVQVDAIGGYGGTLVLVECKSSLKGGKGLRDYISGFRGKFLILSNGIKEHSAYKKYTKIIFVLATKKIEMGKNDDQFIRAGEHLEIWNEKYMEYYGNLHDVIGKYALFNLLGEIGGRSKGNEIIRVLAIRMKRWIEKENKYEVLYNFLIDPKELLKIAYVARREHPKEQHFYQRAIKKNRLKKINKFLSEGNTFANNIIINLEKNCHFRCYPSIKSSFWPKGMDIGLLIIPKDSYRSAWIIDGQHRLYGFSKFSGERQIPVVAFQEIPKEKQMALFVDINREQTQVSSDLIWDLEYDLDPTSVKGRISLLARELNKEEPLKGKIKYSSGKNKIKISALCDPIKHFKIMNATSHSMKGAKTNKLYDRDANANVKKSKKAINSYFRLVDRFFPKNVKTNFVYNNTGISIMFGVFEMILAHLEGAPTEQNMEKYVKAFGDFFKSNYPSKKELDSLRKGITGWGARAELLKMIQRHMQKYLNNKEFGGRMKPETEMNEIVGFERDFCKFVVKTLDEKNKGKKREDFWPKDILKRAEKNLKKNVTKHLHECIGLGECIAILSTNDNYKDTNLIDGRNFIDRSDLFNGLKRINKMRIEFVHHETSTLSGFALVLAKEYMKIIRHIMENAKNIE